MNRVNEKIWRSRTNQGYCGHRNDKCELNLGSVIINLYMEFTVHSSNVSQVIVLEVASRWTDGRTDRRTRRMTTIGIRQTFSSGSPHIPTHLASQRTPHLNAPHISMHPASQRTSHLNAPHISTHVTSQRTSHLNTPHISTHLTFQRSSHLTIEY